MNMSDCHLLADYSLEIIAREAAAVALARTELAAGTEVKIAYLGSETLEQRLAAVEALAANQLNPMPIISSRRLDSANTLETYISEAKKVADIDRVFVVGGDPAKPQGPFSDSLEVIVCDRLQSFDIQTVGIAGYPQGNPHIPDEVLEDYLIRKYQALTERGFKVEITTQLAFDAEAVIRWIEQIRRDGINAPVRVGIPGPTTLTGLLKFAKQCRVSTSLGMLKQFGWKVTSLLAPVGPESFVTALQEGIQQKGLTGVHLHIYPMGNLNGSAQWAKQHLSSGEC
ncbi:methylenetetrahydrofolate reductase [Endozoicomonas arenosclerae]|uniref:methylenetetrahydrofolate reductase n=1 Tax=Endozoicomonas arenosclerae TaxID=1633495 RepID=UPI0007817FFF|nr:methylenetetrahydrofolate reductase [Endozoicomonas arenosclerae]